jgi:hypothetical protein
MSKKPASLTKKVEGNGIPPPVIDLGNGFVVINGARYQLVDLLKLIVPKGAPRVSSPSQEPAPDPDLPDFGNDFVEP